MLSNKKILYDFVRAILAGMFICIGCAVNLKVGGVAGACLFSFGLAGIIAMQLNLFTGIAGDDKQLIELVICIGGNEIGTALMGTALGWAVPGLREAALAVVESREALHSLALLLLAIPCGIIVTTAVHSARKGNWIPLLLGVPVFILCGFPHCIADAGYIYLANRVYSWWPLVYVGNYLGCNFHKTYLFLQETQKK